MHRFAFGKVGKVLWPVIGSAHIRIEVWLVVGVCGLSHSEAVK